VPVIWLVAGVLLAIAELFTLDFVLIMLAAGALGAAVAGLVLPLPLQLLVFAGVSTLGVLAVRPAIKRRLHLHADPQPMGMDAVEGSEAMVIEQVAEGRGMVKIGGEHWQARPYDNTQVIDAGVLVRIVEVKGAMALVWRE
jgi:membrane protein implicated in regulation of membrane protease activity